MGRKILLIILAPFFSLLLFMLAFDYGAARIVGSADNVKRIVSDSGIYESIVPSLLRQTGQIDTAIGSIPAADPMVQEAANKALTPSDIQKNSESAIDNIYSWLNGKTAQPSFSIDFSNSKESFANNLSGEVQQKLSSLPTCTTPYTSANFDALNATCLPPGVSAAKASGLLKSEILNSNGFLDKTTINSADFKTGDSNQPVFQQGGAKAAPGYYQKMKDSPPVLALLIIVLGAALVFLRPTLASGLRHIGATLLSVGIAMLIFSWALNYLVNNKITPSIRLQNAAMQTNLRKAVGDLAHQIDKNYWTFGGIYTVVGAAVLATPLFLKPKALAATRKAKTEDSAAAPEPVTGEQEV